MRLMDEPPHSQHLPPNTSHYVLDRVVDVRRIGTDLQFVVSPRDRLGYELAVRYVDASGTPQRQWLSYGRNRDALEQIRLALEAQEPERG
jgi:hypothetical protein